jgi:molybdate transport system substrate-binding protein
MLVSLLACTTHAADIRVATASNFAATLSKIAQQFEKETGHRVRLSTSSTGKHYAQIHNGAPFDAFFAADTRRPQLLEQQGKTVEGSRFTYALGTLALWSPNGEDAQEMLFTSAFQRLAIANPRLAPYGQASKEALKHLGLWKVLERKLVRGENIGQTYHFVHSGSAELGLVALSQLRDPKHPQRGSIWLVPESYHDPIEQQAVRLTDKKAAEEFMDFVKSPSALAIIERYGYGTAQ